MASYKLSLFLLVLAHGLLFLSHQASCNDDEDNVFQGLNSYRQSQKLPDLKRNKKAACLADKIADDLEDQSCSSAAAYTIAPGNGRKFQRFKKLAKKCDININTTTDGIIWPVCVPNLDQDLVIKNYNHSRNTKYLNNSKYTGAGVGSEDNWVVVILSTDTGSFSGAAALVANGMVHYLVAMLLGLFLILMC